ncbi:MAG: methyltransferase domain-containing protein [Bacteroidota bacterium]
MQHFEKVLKIRDDLRVLDVGGTQYNWQFMKHRCFVVIVNLSKPAEWDDRLIDFTFEKGDGTKMKYDSNIFDIVYSNSVIEHLGTWEMQIAFAHECSRVGKGLWVQTPAKCFPVEPHLITPFIHWLPLKLQSRLMRNFTLWGIITRPTQQFIDGFLRERRLLSLREMKILFPDCRIVKERFLFMTKSYIAVRINQT